jgi:hypothetical protein
MQEEDRNAAVRASARPAEVCMSISPPAVTMTQSKALSTRNNALPLRLNPAGGTGLGEQAARAETVFPAGSRPGYVPHVLRPEHVRDAAVRKWWTPERSVAPGTHKFTERQPWLNPLRRANCSHRSRPEHGPGRRSTRQV